MFKGTCLAHVVPCPSQAESANAGFQELGFECLTHADFKILLDNLFQLLVTLTLK